MRCYFNLVDGSEVILDRTGIEVSGPEEARTEALHARGNSVRPIRSRHSSGMAGS